MIRLSREQRADFGLLAYQRVKRGVQIGAAAEWLKITLELIHNDVAPRARSIEAWIRSARCVQGRA